MSLSPQRILVTGSNGHLGQRWLEAAGADAGTFSTRAVVRSERARSQLEGLPPRQRPEEIRVVDYDDPSDLARAAEGCDAALHLVGILRETSTTSYRDAHETSATALARAADEAGLKQIVYPSLFGADPRSQNPCLASKGRAEEILRAASTPTLVLRLPMVLGPGDPGSRALLSQARSHIVPLVAGGDTLQQPIDARDVVLALRAACGAAAPIASVLELGGPEVLSHRALLLRAASLLGTQPRIVGVPRPLAGFAVGALERLLPSPPLTRAVFEILEHDDCCDNGPALLALGIALRDLDSTLRYCASEAEN